MNNEEIIICAICNQITDDFFDDICIGCLTLLMSGMENEKNN